MSSTLERGLTLTPCLSAATIAGSVAWREFGTSPIAPTGLARSPLPELTPGWEEALSVGILVGDASARITVVEFSDLECPACARFQDILEESLQEYPQDVAFIFVHMPLEGHRFAQQAARVVDCAESHGRFLPMIRAIFSKQDSLGLKSWGSFAVEAGISDSASISECAWDTRPVARIEAGLALAKELGVRATPTVFVNGWRFEGPNKEELTQAIEAVLRGRTPGAAGMN